MTSRVTTGFNKSGQSVILQEESLETFIPYPLFSGFQLQNLFYTEDKPQTLKTRHFDKPYEIDLPEGALRFLKVRMPTKTEMITDLQKAGAPIPEDWTKFNLHSTDTIDYLYILSGKVTCIIGEMPLPLSEGDFIAQFGPMHTWINDHSEPCYMLCVMVGLQVSGERKKLSVEK